MENGSLMAVHTHVLGSVTRSTCESFLMAFFGKLIAHVDLSKTSRILGKQRECREEMVSLSKDCE
jgi:hypothetical protein